MGTIYTCTMNLAIDLFIETEQLLPQVVNRTLDDEIQANGKGVNVSLILKMLDIPSTALGFSGGFTGKYIEDFLSEKHIKTDFVAVNGMTRINVFTQVNEENKEYKLVNQGPAISPENVERLLAKIKTLVPGDFLCVSGSLPKGVQPTVLIEISKICQEREVKLIIDSSYKEVRECLQYRPYLIKPNEDELATLFDVATIAPEDYQKYGQMLIAEGAQNVLLSLGSEGGIFFNEATCLIANAPKGKVVNTACAGDSLLGTFIAGMVRKEEVSHTLKRSIAAGSSTAFKKGLTDFLDILELEAQIHVHRKEVHK